MCFFNSLFLFFEESELDDTSNVIKVIKKGDTLWKLAEGILSDEKENWNNLSEIQKNKLIIEKVNDIAGDNDITLVNVEDKIVPENLYPGKLTLGLIRKNSGFDKFVSVSNDVPYLLFLV